MLVFPSTAAQWARHFFSDPNLNSKLTSTQIQLLPVQTSAIEDEGHHDIQTDSKFAASAGRTSSHLKRIHDAHSRVSEIRNVARCG
jgi:hypothetical protein